MAKPLPRLPVAGVGGESPTISLSDDGWSKIEAACGWSFDRELRDAIRTRTNVYLRDAQFELNAKPRAPALDRLQRVRKAGARFQAELMRAPEPESARYANFLIKQNFADSRLKYGGPTDAIHAMHGVTASFVFACERGEKELENDGARAFQPGESWNVWVRDLADVLQERGFPIGFVVLIQELQKLADSWSRYGRPTDAIHGMHEIMASFVLACDLAEKELEKNRARAFQRGEAWNVWVRDLAGVLQKRGFPTGVRKDVDKSDTTSPFVRFIWELQELIPQEFRRGSHSKVALATLISKAIRGR
jgi:hypothetical protein